MEEMHGIPKINRNKPCSYSDELFAFAIDLRRGNDLVTFDTIRKEVGIHKGTLCCYAQRNHILLSGGRGRSYLTLDERERLKQIRDKDAQKNIESMHA